MSAIALVQHAVERVRPAEAGVAPIDPPRAYGSGPAPYRLLLVGGAPVHSRGVTRHELGLSGAIARGVAGLTGHGVDVEAVPVAAGDGRSIERALRDRDLARVDGLVLVIDAEVLDGGEGVRRLHRLLLRLWGAMTPASGITVVSAPAADGTRGPDCTASLDELRAGAAALTRVVELDDASGILPFRERYAAWGARIAEAVAEGLVEPLVWSTALEELDERKRAAAIRRLGPFDSAWEASLQRLVKDVARAYGAASAAVTVLDGPRAMYLAGSDVRERVVPREETICRTALRTFGGLMIGDAQADEAFRDLPSVESGAVRFYGGYRIDAPDGVPLAVLCVFDPEPREVRGQDITLLRDFAHLAERLIREYRRPAV